jgi:hypothetical protein
VEEEVTCVQIAHRIASFQENIQNGASLFPRRKVSILYLKAELFVFGNVWVYDISVADIFGFDGVNLFCIFL